MSDLKVSTKIWTLSQKVGFRFSFIFFLGFIIFVNNGAFPNFYSLTRWLHALARSFVPWFAREVIQLTYEITIFTNGSGDTTYDYIVLLILFALAATITTLWSVLDRKRNNYETLYYYLTVAVRFYVGLMLFNYGCYKLFRLQFPSPSMDRLVQPYGDSSPMGLAWTFLGFSDGYNYFMGIAEVSAILLLFRRTLIAGTLSTLMTTANVMAVNYFFDVPVKIVSTMLVVMTLYLMLPDASRLWNFFFRGQAVALPARPQPNLALRHRRIGLTLKFGLLGYVFILALTKYPNAMYQYGERAPNPPLYGLYEVEHFILQGDTVLPLITDSTRWRQLMVIADGFARVRFMDNTTQIFLTKLDTAQRILSMKQRSDTTRTINLTYNVSGNRYHFKGVIQQDSLVLDMTRFADIREKFTLTSRGFHWISEYPFNR